MYALGMTGIIIGLMALLFSIFNDSPRPDALKAHTIMQNYVIAQGAVQEAVLVAAAKAPQLAVGTPILAGSACVAPLTASTACDLPLGTGISADINAFLPPMWTVLTDSGHNPRWKARIQGGMAFVYGAVNHEEMAALRAMQSYGANLALCVGGSNANACQPVLQQLQADGSRIPLPLPPDVATASASQLFAVHVLRLVP